MQIDLAAGDAWNYYQQNKEELRDKEVVIAQNMDTKVSICLTESDNLPLFVVYSGEGKGEKEEYSEYAVSASDCEHTVKEIYKRYLFPIVVDTKADESEDRFSDFDRAELEDIIYKRREIIRDALLRFLSVAVNTEDTDPDGSNFLLEYGNQLVDETLEYFLEFLGCEQGLDVYYPLLLVDEDGSEEFTAYPYSADAYSDFDECDEYEDCERCPYREDCEMNAEMSGDGQ